MSQWGKQMRSHWSPCSPMLSAHLLIIHHSCKGSGGLCGKAEIAYVPSSTVCSEYMMIWWLCPRFLSIPQTLHTRILSFFLVFNIAADDSSMSFYKSLLNPSSPFRPPTMEVNSLNRENNVTWNFDIMFICLQTMCFNVRKYQPGQRYGHMKNVKRTFEMQSVDRRICVTMIHWRKALWNVSWITFYGSAFILNYGPVQLVALWKEKTCIVMVWWSKTRPVFFISK